MVPKYVRRLHKASKYLQRAPALITVHVECVYCGWEQSIERTNDGRFVLSIIASHMEHAAACSGAPREVDDHG